MIYELKTRVDELKTENAYQLRLRDVSYNEKIRELTEKFVNEMEQLKTKIAVSRYVTQRYPAVTFQALFSRL